MAAQVQDTCSGVAYRTQRLRMSSESGGQPRHSAANPDDEPEKGGRWMGPRAGDPYEGQAEDGPHLRTTPSTWGPESHELQE